MTLLYAKYFSVLLYFPATQRYFKLSIYVQYNTHECLLFYIFLYCLLNLDMLKLFSVVLKLQGQSIDHRKASASANRAFCNALM